MKRVTAVKTILICGFCLFGVLPSCVPITISGDGSISGITPSEGTVGTVITINGANLGAAGGEVLVGTAKAELVQWSPTQVVARVAGTLSVGSYDVTVKPLLQTPVTYSSFTVREPEFVASNFHPNFLSGGETMTLTGQYLGTKTGKVQLRNRNAQSVDTTISNWSMESVTFQVPTGLTGLWDLVVINSVAEVAEPSWGTFKPCPQGGLREHTSVNVVGVAHETHETPAPIQFEGALWVLSAGGDTDLIADAYTNLETWDNMPDPPGKSYTMPAPLVVDGFLWLFNTAKDGTIEYFKYASSTKTWSSAIKVPNVSTENNCALGVAYNSADGYDRIELFYYNGGSIYRTYTDNRGGAWSTPVSVVSANWAPSALFWESAVYWDSTTSTTVSVPNATVLAYPYNKGIKVSYLQDGVVVHTAVKSTSSTLEYFRPYLVDLGEDYIAVVCNGPSCEPVVRKASKSTGKWSGNWEPIDNPKTCCWSSTGAVGVKKVADTNSVGGYRYDTYLYIFWGKNDGGLFDDDEWTMSAVENLGYYLEPNDPEPSDFASQEADTFYLWPVLGVVDAPPFVANGVDIASQDCTLHDCTRTEFGVEGSTYLTIGGSASAGIFVESGEHCRLKLEIDAEINASINTEKSLSSGREDVLYRDMEGVVMALYLAPQFQTHTYEWYDLGDIASGKYLYVVELIDLGIERKTFLPTELPVSNAANVSTPYWTNFPMHAFETDLDRLNSYNTTYSTSDCWFHSDGDWGKASDGGITWTTTTATETETGLDIAIKVGKNNNKKMPGGGVEGSFELSTSTTTELTASAKVHLINADASMASRGDIESFHVRGYWLAPSEDGFWVPRNRQGMGDKPWFITYQVTSLTPYEAD